MNVLFRTNPLEDLGRLLTRPLAFASQLATDESATSNWALAKAMGFFIFSFALVSIANLAPRAELTADGLEMLTQMARPLLDAMGFTSSHVAAYESVLFFGTRLGTEMMIFFGVFQAFFALILLSALLSLIWPTWGFRRLLCWTAYSHWFVLLGLLVSSSWLISLVAAFYLARVTLEAEAPAPRFAQIFWRGGLIGLLSTVISLLGLSPV